MARTATTACQCGRRMKAGLIVCPDCWPRVPHPLKSRAFATYNVPELQSDLADLAITIRRYLRQLPVTR